MTRPPGLPDFARPPVVEVLLDATLDPLPLVRNAHLGVFWAEHARATYPSLEEQPPVSSVEEQFGSEQSPLQFRFDAGVPVMRQWFVSEDASRVFQLQQDRFIENWRKPSPDAVYPRYEPLRDSFEDDFRAYAKFLRDHDLGEVTIRQAEISYINRVHLDRGEGIEAVLRAWRPDFGPEMPTEPVEDVRVAWRHLISGPDGPFARLYVSVEPQPGGLALQLTLRGKPRNGSLEACLELFDLGRERIVTAFAAITTDARHQVWERKS